MRITTGFAPDVIDVNVKNNTGTLMAAGTVVYFNVDGLTITTSANDNEAGTLLNDVLPNGGVGLARKMGPYNGTYIPLSGSGGSVTPGTGLTESPAGTLNVDPTYAATLGAVQSGTPLYVASASASATVYTAATTPAWSPTPWTTGSRIHFVPDIACGATPTLNLNGAGAVTIKRGDGSAIVAGDLVAGKIYNLDFDGTNWRAQNVPSAIVPLTLATTGEGFFFVPFGGFPKSTNTGDVVGGKTAPWFMQFSTATGMTLRTVACDVSSGVLTAGTGMAVAIYDAAKNRIGAATSQVITTAQRDTFFTFATPLLLQPNTVYYLGWACDDADLTLWEWDTNPEILLIANQSTNYYRFFKGDQAASSSGVNLLMPATIGTKGNPGSINGLPWFLLLP